MQFISGLVSISFRSLSPTELIARSVGANLSAIEWGADVHVPAGNTKAAKEIAAMTRKANLRMPEYGSYHKLGIPIGEDIADTVVSAAILQTPAIRLWASDRARRDMNDETYRHIVAETKRICQTYPEITFCLECHNNTLTEDYQDTLRFLSDVNCENLGMFWQPNQFRDHAYNLDSLKALLPYIHSVHVFAWEGTNRFPLACHTDRWMDYLTILKASEREQIYLMLEFMHDDNPESIKPTADTLNEWIRIVG